MRDKTTSNVYKWPVKKETLRFSLYKFFRPRSTASVHGRQLPSTLLHRNTLFIAFSMNELKRKETQFNQVMIISEIQGQYGE